MVIYLPTHHLRALRNSFIRVRAFQIELEFRNAGFWGEGKTGVPGEKPLGARRENQQQTQSTYNAGSGNRTQATPVGGKRSHHCATPAPPKEQGWRLQNRLHAFLSSYIPHIWAEFRRAKTKLLYFPGTHHGHRVIMAYGEFSLEKVRPLVFGHNHGSVIRRC